MSRVRRMAVLGLIAVVAGCATPPPSPFPPMPAENGLRVMSYNLLGAMGDDAIFSEQAGWAARIDQLSPDVVVLQEAQAADVAAIVARTTTDYTRAAYVQWDCDLKPEREGVAILVKSGLATSSGGGVNVGGSCANPSVKRVLVWVDVELDDGPLRVYGTHLSQSGAAYDASREAQIRLIRGIIAADDPTDARRWVLAGDLNARPGDESYRLMMGGDPADPDPHRFVDSYAELTADAADPVACPTYSSGDAVGMAYLWAHPDHVRRCGYTAGWPKDDNWLGCNVLSLCVAWQTRQVTSVRERLDYVVVAEDGPFGIIDARVPHRSEADWAAPGQEWYRLSDHLPVIADIDVGSVTQVDPAASDRR